MLEIQWVLWVLAIYVNHTAVSEMMGGVPQIIQVMDDQVVFETWFLWIRHDLRNPIA